MIENVFTKEETERSETNVDIRDDSRVVARPYERFSFTVIGTWEFSNLGPRGFLDKDDVKLNIRLEYGVSDD
ncbi:hypothetical protein Ac2012v2_008066 [Leucoagaricus gongylophorus]